MAVNLSPPEQLAPIAGVRVAAVEAGVRYRDRLDMALFVFEPGTTVAGVYTRNAYCAAPVTVAREHQGTARAWLINAGNANAGTGAQGLADARACCERVAERVDLGADAVMPFSTGVISEALPMATMNAGIDAAAAALSESGWMDAARAIMTTDTVLKGVSRAVDIGGQTLNITGIAKGSGMIHPDMATMLGFIACDAAVPADDLQACLDRANARSFNCVTVDGDTSTNDACVLAATGRGALSIDAASPHWETFCEAVQSVALVLAQALVRDGEGATKYITLAVTGGRNEEECRQVGFTVAHSPLVKTAFFASDPNLGRVLAAIGRSGLDGLDVSRIDVALDEVALVLGGEPAPDYTEARGQAVMARDEITVSIDLKRGDATATLWTTDLSHEYVRINAEYRS